MTRIEFFRVERPKREIREPVNAEFCDALVDTLRVGDALAVPINGESHAVVRNRKCSAGRVVANRLNANLRTSWDASRGCVLVWLEARS